MATARELSPGTDQFYREGTLSFDGYQGQGGHAFRLGVTAPAQPIITEFEGGDDLGVGVGTKIRALYDSLEEIRVKTDEGEKVIEAGIIQGTGGRVRLHAATYSSSLAANHGNGFDEALCAHLDPEITHVYVGAPGIGLSSPLSTKERKFVSKHGSFMDIDASDGSIRPLPHVQAVHGVLRHLGVNATDLHGDSAGALVTTALGAAYGQGNIRTIHQNVRPGIKDIGPFALAYGMLYLTGVQSKPHAELSPDVLKMGPDKIGLVEANLSSEFIGRDLRLRRSNATLLANLVGLGRGPSQGDPLVRDNVAFARANPAARILLTVGAEDPLAKGDDLAARLEGVVSNISAYTYAPVYAVSFPGMSHNIQTHYPQYLRAVSRFLLG